MARDVVEVTRDIAQRLDIIRASLKGQATPQNVWLIDACLQLAEVCRLQNEQIRQLCGLSSASERSGGDGA